jgi:CTP synthase (UTP-ammonia lyase)
MPPTTATTGTDEPAVGGSSNSVSPLAATGQTAAVARIGVIGEFDPGHPTHPATDDALGHSAAALGTQVEVMWVSTADIVGDGVDAMPLDGFDGLLIAPGSPYRSLDGALTAIEHARTKGVPLLGTCGGFQHVVLELARNVLGLADAHHAEYDPDASTLFVTPLSCSLAGQTMAVDIRPDSRAGEAYGTTSADERYYCNFGLAPERVDDLVAAGLRVTGTDEHGEVRIVELPGQPFYVATLFVPQTSSTPVRPHPLVTAFVAAAAEQPAEPARIA